MRLVRLLSAARIAQLFGFAIFDQVLLSGANFLVGFLLIRKTSDADYGMFVVVQSTLTLLVAFQGSWLSNPLTVVSLQKTPERRREMIGSIQGSQSRFLRLAACSVLVVPEIVYYFGGRNVLVTIAVAGGILAGVAALRREYLRSVLLIYQRPQSLLRADMVYVTVLLAGVLFAAFGPKPAMIAGIATLAVAAWAGGWLAYRQLGADPGWVRGDAGPVWREIRSIGIWSAVGAVIYWLFTQSYVYVLATRLDLTAVANVNATRLLLMPVIVLTVGMYSLLTPSAAAWLAEFGFNRLMRRLCGFIVVISALDLMYFGLVWHFRDWITADLLHKTIADRDSLLMLWAGVAFVGLVRDVLQCALLALGRQKVMAWLIAFSAVVSIALMWFGLPKWGPSAVLIAQIVGELVNLAGLIALLVVQYQIYSRK